MHSIVVGQSFRVGVGTASQLAAEIRMTTWARKGSRIVDAVLELRPSRERPQAEPTLINEKPQRQCASSTRQSPPPCYLGL